MGSRIIRSICFECHSRCGVLLEVENGRLVGFKGDKEHPHSRGYTCPKGRACMELVYHPERITKPLVNVGPHKSGSFEETSWDKALGIIAERLLDAREKWGAESVVFGTGTTRAIPPFIYRFMALFGSPNVMAPSNMSGGPLALGSHYTTGFYLGGPDYDASRCIMLWAHNPDASWPGLYMNGIRKALKEGAKLIVVDPRRIPLAKKADYWLPIRPGTDVAMALCFINIAIENELYDKEFVDQWTVGFDQLREHVRPFTAEKTAEITWVPRDLIESAALMFAKTSPACIGPGPAGVCQANDAFDLSRALSILTAITGNLEIPGGQPNYKAPTKHRQCYGGHFDLLRTLPEEQAAKKLTKFRFPAMGSLQVPPEVVWQAILEENPYPVKAIGLFANNTMCSYANSQEVKSALTALEFLFAVDYFQTPTTQMADVVLPPAHWTERDDIEDLLMKNSVFCQPKALEPIPECRDEKQILIDLAEKMGLEGYWKTPHEGLNERLEMIGMTFDQFKEAGRYSTPVIYRSYENGKGFKTPSGKVEIYAAVLEKYGLSPLPVFREPGESPVSTPELYREFPLVLTTGARNIAYYHSAHRNVPSLRKRSPDPELQIHPKTAGKYDIEDGEWISLATIRGRVEIRARYYEDIHPEVVQATHGYWYGVADGWRRLNINGITDNRNVCPVCASVPVKGMLCRIEKMEAQTVTSQ